MLTAKRRTVVGLLVVFGCAASGSYVYRMFQRDAQAVRAIEELGGTVRRGTYGRAVDLCFAEVTDQDLQVLADLSNLSELDLRYSQVTDGGLAALGKLRSVTNLNLAHTSITGEGLHNLRSLPLVGLHLQSSFLNDDGAKHLPSFSSLSRLNLGSTNITDASVEFLKKLGRLDSLNVAGTDITNSGAATLKNALPSASIYTGSDRGQLIPNMEFMLPGEPAWAMTSGHRTMRFVEELASPILLVEGVGFLDGGTQGARLKDATGKELLFCFTPGQQWFNESDGFLANRAYVGGMHASSPGCRLLPIEGEELPRLMQYLNEVIENANNHRTLSVEEDKYTLKYAESLQQRLAYLAKLRSSKK